MNLEKLVSWRLFVSLVAIFLVLHSQVDAQSAGDGEGSKSLLDTLMYPIRETFRKARRLFGSRMDNVHEFVEGGFSSMQAETFGTFMQLYNKSYSPSELPKRMALFFERRKLIEDSVKAFSEGKLPFTMQENPFIDWDETELRALTGVSPPKSLDELSAEEREAFLNNDPQPAEGNSVAGDEATEEDTITLDIPMVSKSFETSEANLTVRAPVSIPAKKDWRTSDCVAAPMDQEKCGCCYAIATMGVLESMRCLTQVSSPILSVQQIIDCSTPRAGYKNYGCNGGWPTRVLKYLQDVGVSTRQICYPFVKRQEYCKLNKVRQVTGCPIRASASNDVGLRYKVLNNERDILYHVATTGPVITVMRATDRFLYYGSGIFDDPKCSRKADDVDHAIQIVGYGRENGIDYWLIKNSWGASWGQAGYGKYKRGTNACSIGHWGWVILP